MEKKTKEKHRWHHVTQMLIDAEWGKPAGDCLIPLETTCTTASESGAILSTTKDAGVKITLEIPPHLATLFKENQSYQVVIISKL